MSMKDINLNRALGFSLILYIGTLLIFGVLSAIFRFFADSSVIHTPVLQYVVYWIVFIFLILILSKWYFRKLQPSAKRGVILGICAVIVSIILDVVSIFFTTTQGTSFAWALREIYTSWTFYVTIVLLIATTAYAGFEFDRTYTFDETGLSKKS